MSESDNLIPRDEEDGCSEIKSVKVFQSRFFKIKRVLKALKRQEFIVVLIALVLTFTWFGCLQFKQTNLPLKQSESIIQQQNLSYLSVHQSTSSIIEPDSQTSQEDRWVDIAIKHSKSDTKEYQLHILKNNLKLLLISDPNRVNSIVSLDVRVGFWNDPKIIPGLSHFLEHMKFQSYCKSCESLKNYISKHEGLTNAYTSSQNTNYYYKLTNDGLQQSLQLFSDMFVQPVYSKNRVHKEILAVDSEYVNTLSNDERKISYFLQSITDDSHPFSKLSCGSQSTLQSDKFDILEEVKKHDKQLYSSHIMSLVIISNYTLDQLDQLVKAAQFQNIPQLDYDLQFEKELPIKQESLGKIYKIYGKSTENKLLFIYAQIPNEIFDKRVDYINYLSEILNISSEGGLKQQLMDLGLITQLYMETSSTYQSYSTISFKAILTKKGYSQLDYVLSRYYQCLNQLNNHVNHDNFKTRARLNKIIFDSDGFDGMNENYIHSIASELNKADTKEEAANVLLANNENYKKFDQEKWNGILEILSDPLKCIIAIQSNNFDPEQAINSRLFKNIDNHFELREDKFNLDYGIVAEITNEYARFLVQGDDHNTSQFNIELDLSMVPDEIPIQIYSSKDDNSKKIHEQVILKDLDIAASEIFEIKNKEYSQDPYEKFSLQISDNGQNISKFAFNILSWDLRIEESSDEIKTLPVLLYHSHRVRSFYMIDASQKQPKAKLRIRLFNRKEQAVDPEKIVILEIYLQAVQKQLQETFPAALQSSIAWDVIGTQRDILQMNLVCWREHILDVTYDLVSKWRSPQITSEEWQFGRQNKINQLQVLISKQLLISTLFSEYVKPFIDMQSFSLQKHIELLQSADYTDPQGIAQLLHEATDINILTSGNISPIESIKITKQLQQLIPLEEPSGHHKRHYKILNFTNSNYRLSIPNPNSNDANSAIVNLYQIGERNLDDLIYLSLLEDKMNLFFFEYLRTQKGLGYIVSAKMISFGCVDHLGILLQGDKKQPKEIDKMIEKGLIEFKKEIQGISNEEFEERMGSLRSYYEKKSQQKQSQPSKYQTLYPNSQQSQQSQMDVQFDLMWEQIEKDRYDFDFSFYVIHHIDNKLVTLEQLQSFYERNFIQNRNKFSFQMHSKNDNNKEKQKTQRSEIVSSQVFLEDQRSSDQDIMGETDRSKLTIVKKKQDIMDLQDDKYFKCQFQL